jgi:uncharacterized protein with PQ loop repeat
MTPMVQVFGILASIVSLVVIVAGLPAQIWKNYKNKNCTGLSFSLFF